MKELSDDERMLLANAIVTFAWHQRDHLDTMVEIAVKLGLKNEIKTFTTDDLMKELAKSYKKHK